MNIQELNEWNELKLELLRKRGWKCEWCNENRAHHLHHFLIPKSHHRQGMSIPELNERYNVALVCHDCHEKEAVGWDARLKFWKIQCIRYGARAMADWLDRVPLKVKPKFPIFQEEER